jgi:hypothetical protein
METFIQVISLDLFLCFCASYYFFIERDAGKGTGSFTGNHVPLRYIIRDSVHTHHLFSEQLHTSLLLMIPAESGVFQCPRHFILLLQILHHFF